MLGNAPFFYSFSTNDMARTQDFYDNILGLKVKKHEMGMLQVHIQGKESCMIYPKENHVPATFTVLNFEVTDIEEKVDALIAKGISFEHYPAPLKTDEKGICWPPQGTNRPAIAWFKDPGGNILSLIEERP